ncbi:MAG: MBL fold metallo-hydrolase [Methanomassiliicoccaceae archaeon]|nr:MBL fold metallo-hydrolase [Methanomassiliicoccaceae archaeon]
MMEIKAQGTYYPVLAWDDEDVLLFDTGLPGQFELIKEEIGKCGFSPEQVTKVILTHQDVDHIGNAKIFRDLGAEIMAHETETPFIQGDSPLTKLADMEAHIDKLPPERLGFYKMLKAAAPGLYVHVDRPLKDGEIIPACGGIKVIHTPGHTPGHIALLLLESGILICGDAANIADCELCGSNPMHTHDASDAERSFGRIISTGARGYVCYHGGYLAE